MITTLADLSVSAKSDLVASLATFLAGSGTAAEGEELITPAKLQAIADASGSSLSESLATLYASVSSKAPGGVLKAYMPSPGGGGGGSGGGGGDGGAAAAEEEKVEEKEEEEEMDMGGGMSMFGEEEGAGGGDY